VGISKLTSDTEHGAVASASGGVTCQVVDNDPRLLEQSYQLRYQVYCLEREFLPASAYPDGLEIDEFDAHSVRIGVFNSEDEILGTARLVEPSPGGLPLFQHCTIFEDA